MVEEKSDWLSLYVSGSAVRGLGAGSEDRQTLQGKLEAGVEVDSWREQGHVHELGALCAAAKRVSAKSSGIRIRDVAERVWADAMGVERDYRLQSII